MWGCRDSQDVGLEAAIIERVRNCSLVQEPCAENVTGLKYDTEATDLCRKMQVVGERCTGSEGRA